MTAVHAEDMDGKEEDEKPHIKGDRLNILLLVLLYTLQGGVGGLFATLPLVMQNRGVSYADQAEFSITFYPSCMKLLWAPMVDCMYVRRFGRRKSWLIPMQYIMGFILLIVSINLKDWLGTEEGTQKPRVRPLTIAFLFCMFFTCVQDVALDGWSLTMLQRRNIGYAGICSTVGNTIGHFISFTLCIILDSKVFCNMFRSVAKDHGFVSIDDFILFWSIVLIVCTTLLIFKRDDSLDNVEDENECKLGFMNSYKHLWKILQVRPIQMLGVVLLTYQLAFGPMEGASLLKFIDAGISRDKLVLFNIPSLPVQLILSVVLGRYIAGPQSMQMVIYLYMIKLIIAAALVLLFFCTTYINQPLPIWYYSVFVFIHTAKNVVKYLTSIATMAFFLRISDPRFAGIYLTLLTTMSNIGFYWPVTLSLSVMEIFSIETCTEYKTEIFKNCYKILDGYCTETLISTVVGVLWLFWGKKVINKLESMSRSPWIADLKQTSAFKQELLQTKNC